MYFFLCPGSCSRLRVFGIQKRLWISGGSLLCNNLYRRYARLIFFTWFNQMNLKSELPIGISGTYKSDTDVISEIANKLNLYSFHVTLILMGMTTVFNEHQGHKAMISVGAIIQCLSMKPYGPWNSTFNFWNFLVGLGPWLCSKCSEERSTKRRTLA